jgi:hypothetical protein
VNGLDATELLDAVNFADAIFEPSDILDLRKVGDVANDKTEGANVPNKAGLFDTLNPVDADIERVESKLFDRSNFRESVNLADA